MKKKTQHFIKEKHVGLQIGQIGSKHWSTNVLRTIWSSYGTHGMFCIPYI